MERSRECYFGCPYYFDHGETESWGCILFGEECKKNKQLDDETCYVHPRRLQYLAYRYNKRSESLEKECSKYSTEYRKPVTSKKFVQGPFHSGYEVIVNKDFLNSLSKFYRPNMKGGHRHNHIYNICNRILYRSKSGRKICIENKREWREIFEAQVFGGMNPFCRVKFLDILKKGKYFKQITRWRTNK